MSNSWETKSLKLKSGNRLEYTGDQKMRINTWKPDIWLQKGTRGTVVKLNKGSPPIPDLITEDFPDGFPSTYAWATFRLDFDPHATIAITVMNRKDFVKLKQR